MGVGFHLCAEGYHRRGKDCCHRLAGGDALSPPVVALLACMASLNCRDPVSTETGATMAVVDVDSS